MKKKLENYVNCEWVSSKSTRILDVENPASAKIIAKVPMSTKTEVDQVVETARHAWDSWKKVPALKRTEYLYRLRNLMVSDLENIARILTVEHGKILAEAKLEVQRAIENIDVAGGVPTLMQGRTLENIAENIDEQMIRQPVGVCCVIPPFNFPAMIPFWYLPYAVACGNTLIVKPSELVPITQNRIFKLIEKAGFPPGVINLVNGDKEVSNALIEHKDIAAIASVTSTPVAKHIYQKAAALGKRVQCQGGAKNFLIVLPDADLDKAIPNIINSVYGNTGQRCLAAANVVAVGDTHKELRERLVEAASGIKVGYGLDKDVNMGPVISKQAKERILVYIQKGVEEKAELILDRRNVKVEERYKNGYFIGPCIFDKVTIDMTVAREEIFGPVLSLMQAKDLDSSIELIHNLDYGNAATLYTTSGKFAREFQNKVECGNIGINIGVPAPYACFPFCGMKESFFGDVHAQSKDMINFYTHQKVIITRWH